MNGRALANRRCQETFDGRRCVGAAGHNTRHHIGVGDWSVMWGWADDPDYAGQNYSEAIDVNDEQGRIVRQATVHDLEHLKQERGVSFLPTKGAPVDRPEQVPASDEVLLAAAADLDLNAMKELARRENPRWKAAFRQACIDELGEDPEDWQ